MIRFIKRLFTLAVTLALLVAFGYCVVLPRILPLKYQDIVEKYTLIYDLDKHFINGLIFCESRFEPDAISSAGAMGLMQVTQETGWWVAEQMGLRADAIDLTDPETNISIGCWYFNWLMDHFEEEKETALAGYNAGHGKVKKWLNDTEMSHDGITLDKIPYEETKIYVKKVQLAELAYQYIYR